MEIPGIFLLHSKEVLQSLAQPLRKVIFAMFFFLTKFKLQMSCPFASRFYFQWTSKIVCCYFSSDARFWLVQGMKRRYEKPVHWTPSPLITYEQWNKQTQTGLIDEVKRTLLSCWLGFERTLNVVEDLEKNIAVFRHWTHLLGNTIC